MATRKDIDIADAYQGKDRNENPFGYVGITDKGGYFFTWLDTLEATLDSLENDEVDSPRFDFRDAAEDALKEAIGDNFERLHDAAYGQNATYLCRF